MKGRVFLFTSSEIEPGRELTLDYRQEDLPKEYLSLPEKRFL